MKMNEKDRLLIFGRWVFIVSAVLILNGCAVAEGTGDVVWEMTKVGGAVAWEATKLAGRGLKTTVQLVTGTTVVPLRKQNNSMFVKVKINRRITTELLLDTGASMTQISSYLAAQLKVNPSRGNTVMVQVADGRSVQARQVYLKEVRVGRAVVKNVPVVILQQEYAKGYDGLLGMTFLNEFIFRIDAQKGELVLNKRAN